MAVVKSMTEPEGLWRGCGATGPLFRHWLGWAHELFSAALHLDGLRIWRLLRSNGHDPYAEAMSNDDNGHAINLFCYLFCGLAVYSMSDAAHCVTNNSSYTIHHLYLIQSGYHIIIQSNPPPPHATIITSSTFQTR